MELVTFDRIEAIIDNRDRALQGMREKVAILTETVQGMNALFGKAREVAGGKIFYDDRRRKTQAFESLNPVLPPPDAIEVFRQEMDASIWQHLFEVSGIRDAMDHKTLEQWRKDLLQNVPEITYENVRATMEGVYLESDTIFKRGIANAFSALDKRFKSHDAFKVGSRIILPWLFDAYGYIRWNSDTRNYLIDIERVFARLDGKPPAGQTIIDKIEESRKNNRTGYDNKVQAETDTEYFLIRTYKNGNCHLWFKRDDLVTKVNRLLGEYYGAVIPDAAPREKSVEEWNGNTLPSKDLQFYRTPADVVADIVKNEYQLEGKKVLEPSAGDGAFVFPLLAAGAKVTAVEIDTGRFFQMKAQYLSKSATGGDFLNRNFLAMEPVEEYDRVFMNPPFYGTHWMDHVTHAMKFLKPGGTLLAILPVTAEIGESAKHKAFREWMKPHEERYGRTWMDLPPGTFSDSGTNVNTVVLRLKKKA